MQTNHSKTIKGLSIAVIVISAIGIFSCIAGLFALGMGAFAWDQYGMDSIIYSHNQHDGSMAGHLNDGYYGFYYDEDDLFGLVNFALALGGVLAVWELVSSVVTLVAGILGLKRGDEHPRMGSVFGWSVAGAIVAGLAGRFITCVLLIVVAIFANKDKNMTAAEYQGSSAAGSAPSAPPAGYAYTAETAPSAGYAPNAQPTWGQQPVSQPTWAQQPTAQPAPASAYQATYEQHAQPAATQPVIAHPADIQPVAQSDVQIGEADEAAQSETKPN